LVYLSTLQKKLRSKQIDSTAGADVFLSRTIEMGVASKFHVRLAHNTKIRAPLPHILYPPLDIEPIILELFSTWHTLCAVAIKLRAVAIKMMIL
jgi:hypothetical protein